MPGAPKFGSSPAYNMGANPMTSSQFDTAGDNTVVFRTIFDDKEMQKSVESLKGLAQSVTNFAQKTIKIIGDQQEAYNKFRKQAQMSLGEVQDSINKFTDAAVRSGASIQEMADIAVAFRSQGLNPMAKDMYKAAETAKKMSQVFTMDVGRSAQIVAMGMTRLGLKANEFEAALGGLTGAMRDFGITSDEAFATLEEMGPNLIAVVKNGKFGLNSFLGQMTALKGSFKTLGLDFSQVGQMIAGSLAPGREELQKMAMLGGLTGGNINTIMTEAQMDPKAIGVRYAKLADQIYRQAKGNPMVMKIMAEAFGVPMDIAMKSIQEKGQLEKSMRTELDRWKNKDLKTQDAWEKSLTGLSDGWTALKNAFVNFYVSAMPLLSPILKKIGEMMKGVATFINWMSQSPLAKILIGYGGAAVALTGIGLMGVKSAVAIGGFAKSLFGSSFVFSKAVAAFGVAVTRLLTGQVAGGIDIGDAVSHLGGRKFSSAKQLVRMGKYGRMLGPAAAVGTAALGTMAITGMATEGMQGGTAAKWGGAAGGGLLAGGLIAAGAPLIAAAIIPMLVAGTTYAAIKAGRAIGEKIEDYGNKRREEANRGTATFGAEREKRDLAAYNGQKKKIDEEMKTVQDIDAYINWLRTAPYYPDKLKNMIMGYALRRKQALLTAAESGIALGGGSTTRRSAGGQRGDAKTVDLLAYSKGMPAGYAVNTAAAEKAMMSESTEVPPSIKFASDSPVRDLVGLTPAFRGRILAAAADYYAATGNPLQINEAFRTSEHQQRMIDRYGLISEGGRAAPLGSSPHEHGRAVDIPSAQAAELMSRGLLDKYKLKRPVANEPWHIQPAWHGAVASSPGVYSVAEKEPELIAPVKALLSTMMNVAIKAASPVSATVLNQGGNVIIQNLLKKQVELQSDIRDILNKQLSVMSSGQSGKGGSGPSPAVGPAIPKATNWF